MIERISMHLMINGNESQQIVTTLSKALLYNIYLLMYFNWIIILLLALLEVLSHDASTVIYEELDNRCKIFNRYTLTSYLLKFWLKNDDKSKSNNPIYSFK